jgi:hypothetical protein
MGVLCVWVRLVPFRQSGRNASAGLARGGFILHVTLYIRWHFCHIHLLFIFSRDVHMGAPGLAIASAATIVVTSAAYCFTGLDLLGRYVSRLAISGW